MLHEDYITKNTNHEPLTIEELKLLRELVAFIGCAADGVYRVSLPQEKLKEIYESEIYNKLSTQTNWEY